jgi:PleD family two-component response regulator
MAALHDRSAANIHSGGAVVSGGLAEYMPGHDMQMHSVFERADRQMYQEKQLLKSLGAKTRE